MQHEEAMPYVKMLADVEVQMAVWNVLPYEEIMLGDCILECTIVDMGRQKWTTHWAKCRCCLVYVASQGRESSNTFGVS